MKLACALALSTTFTACDVGPPPVVRSSGSGDTPASAVGPGPAPAVGVSADGRSLSCVDDPNSGLIPPWFAFSDQDLNGFVDDKGVPHCEHGASTVQLSQTVGPDGAWCPVAMQGHLDATHHGPFAGIAIRFDQADRRDFEGLVLTTRGDGQRYRLDLVDLYQDARLDGQCDDEDLNHPGTWFSCGDGSGGWREVTISFDELRQRPDWGPAHTLELRDLRRMAVVYDGIADTDWDEEQARPVDFRCEVALARWVPRRQAAR
jgi:hypothetical protein